MTGDRLLAVQRRAGAGDVVVARFADGTVAVKRAVEERARATGPRLVAARATTPRRVSTPAIAVPSRTRVLASSSPGVAWPTRL